MNRKFFIAWIAVFVVWMLGDFVIHGALLFDDYQSVPQLFRSETEAQRYFPFMILAHVMMAGAFVWIYARGREAKPWLGQGLRFGTAAALLGVVPSYIIYYAVQPLPPSVLVKQIAFEAVLMLILGAGVAMIHRPRP